MPNDFDLLEKESDSLDSINSVDAPITNDNLNNSDYVDTEENTNNINFTTDSEPNVENAQDFHFEDTENPRIDHFENIQDNDTQQPEVNYLALTIKKDYSLSIFKNKVKRAVKGSWKIAVSVFVLNFLASFF